MQNEKRLTKGWSRRKKVVILGSAVFVALFVYFGLPLLIVVFAAQPVKIEGSGMSPTLNDGDRVFLSKRVSELKRGDIVVFYYPLDTSKSFIKRVIGLPGELIRMDQKGELLINGERKDEPYLLADRNRNPRVIAEQTIKEGHYYMMGDNRDASTDSRSYGVVRKDLIYGKVVLRYWPSIDEVK